MSRPPLARDAVLDAFTRILVDDGERAATMDATARAAGVSKGGLLYHFNSKSALEAALVERLEHLAREDVAEIQNSTEGVVAAHLRSSQNTGSALDVTILAVSRLAQNGNDTASASLRRVRELWEESLRAHTRDETALQMVLLVSDGLYFNAVLDLNAVPGPALEGADLDKLIEAVVSATT
ncbi:TetR/AcrR family transcriptional regulator [Microbacterium sp. CFBP 8790]|uniref:TetR/AcrR family transcriptional regulator n=1 Tax=unclassified Microbacterium TaxID=2609290 RepID=UPI00177FAACB|nr:MULTISPECIES: TetR/AcrR family transcriptional regulator [unclassified Microbacterium]MBD8204972.1 TetR/AcrR family transcriptional regulator [Microbacterium sp. CFBP 8801]MBD8509973.1 TetR/AcrR family transcriptional regulator [Microbacterium sp. CFBP 8790]